MLLFLLQIVKTEHILTTEVNKYRASKGKPAMQEHPLMNKAAEYQANWMADNEKMAHENPNEGMHMPTDRIKHFGFKTDDSRENVAFNSDNSVDVAMEGWKESYLHEKAMSGDWKYIGSAMKKSSKNGYLYLCNTFANMEGEDTEKKDEDKEKDKEKDKDKEKGKEGEKKDEKGKPGDKSKIPLGERPPPGSTKELIKKYEDMNKKGQPGQQPGQPGQQPGQPGKQPGSSGQPGSPSQGGPGTPNGQPIVSTSPGGSPSFAPGRPGQQEQTKGQTKGSLISTEMKKDYNVLVFLLKCPSCKNRLIIRMYQKKK